MFTMNYYNDLISQLKRKLSVVNGFLDNADVKYADGLISIELKNGGYDLLVKSNFSGEFSKLIQEEFNLNIDVELTGEHNVNVAEHEKMMEEVRASIPQHQEQFGNKPQISREISDPKPPKNTSADISSLEMPFEVIIDSAEIIMGRNIRNTPESIASATAELDRKVTIMADIFDVGEPRNTKSGKTIYSYFITDYTGSIQMKMFVDPKKDEIAVDKLKKGVTVIVSGSIEFDTFSKDITIRPFSIVSVKKKTKAG